MQKLIDAVRAWRDRSHVAGSAGLDHAYELIALDLDALEARHAAMLRVVEAAVARRKTHDAWLVDLTDIARPDNVSAAANREADSAFAAAVTAWIEQEKNDA